MPAAEGSCSEGDLSTVDLVGGANNSLSVIATPSPAVAAAGKVNALLPTPRGSCKQQRGVSFGAPATRRKKQRQDDSKNAPRISGKGAASQIPDETTSGSSSIAAAVSAASPSGPIATKKKEEKKQKKKPKKGASLSRGGGGHMCDRCGKSFSNGHALGGHKKYCGKPEFSKNRKKKATALKKRKRKRKRQQNAGIAAVDRSRASLDGDVDGCGEALGDDGDVGQAYIGHYGAGRGRRGRHHLIGDEDKRWAFLHDGLAFSSAEAAAESDEGADGTVHVTRGQIAQARAYSALLAGLSKWAAQTVLLTDSEQRLILQLEQELVAGAGMGDLYRMERIRQLLANAHGRIGSIVNEMQSRAASAAEAGAGEEFGDERGTDDAYVGDTDDEIGLGEISHSFFYQDAFADEEGQGGRARGHGRIGGDVKTNDGDEGGRAGESSEVHRTFKDANVMSLRMHGHVSGRHHHHIMSPTEEMQSPLTSAQSMTKSPLLMMSVVDPPPVLSRRSTPSFTSISELPLLFSAERAHFGMSKFRAGSRLASFDRGGLGGADTEARDSASPFSHSDMEPIAYSIAVPVNEDDAQPVEAGDASTPMQGPRRESGENHVVFPVPILEPSVLGSEVALEATTAAVVSIGPPRGISRASSLVSSYFR